MDQHIDEFNINIQPNPFNEFVQISNIPFGSILNISDILGNVVYSNPNISNNTTINTKDLANNVYFLQVTNNGKTTTKTLFSTK